MNPGLLKTNAPGPAAPWYECTTDIRKIPIPLDFRGFLFLSLQSLHEDMLI